MAHEWFNVQANAGAPARVSIRGYIGEWGLNDRDFIAALAATEESDEIHVSINSRGGEIDHALSIYNHLRSLGKTITVHIDGVAASAATIIAMAGDEIVMPANAMMMVHKPLSLAGGNADDLRKRADDLDHFEAALLETYTARTGKSGEELAELLAAETWMTAAKAVELGFADRVTPLNRRAAVALAEAVQIPDAVLAEVEALEADPEPDSQPQAADPAPEPDPTPDPAPDPTASAAAIAELCMKHGMPQLAGECIRAKLTVEQVGLKLLDARAQADEQRPTFSANPDHPAAAPAVNETGWDTAFRTIKR